MVEVGLARCLFPLTSLLQQPAQAPAHWPAPFPPQLPSRPGLEAQRRGLLGPWRGLLAGPSRPAPLSSARGPKVVARPAPPYLLFRLALGPGVASGLGGQLVRRTPARLPPSLAAQRATFASHTVRALSSLSTSRAPPVSRLASSSPSAEAAAAITPHLNPLDGAVHEGHQGGLQARLEAAVTPGV